MQTIAATTTRTGLRVHAELDTSTYDTGVRISGRLTGALPLTRHAWHGDWNYALRPEASDQTRDDPDPLDRPSPDLAWLSNPALTLAGPAPGCHPAPAPRPAPGHHRRPVQRPARNHQQANP